VILPTVSAILFRTTAAGLLTNRASFEDQISRRFEEVMRRAPAEGERRSWRNSLPALASVLSDAGLGGVEMLVDYRLPLSSKRADVLLVGTTAPGIASVLGRLRPLSGGASSKRPSCSEAAGASSAPSASGP
jgi:hypothetical protein